MTDATGMIQDESDYFPWGGEIPYVNNLDNHYKFTGKERDNESGLDYFGARYYSNGLGRFISTDPIHFQASMLRDPQRFNLYAYVRNNPLRFVDPKGEAIELTGDEEKRKKTLAAAQSAVGKEAGKYLYENKVETTDRMVTRQRDILLESIRMDQMGRDLLLKRSTSLQRRFHQSLDPRMSCGLKSFPRALKSQITVGTAPGSGQ